MKIQKLLMVVIAAGALVLWTAGVSRADVPAHHHHHGHHHAHHAAHHGHHHHGHHAEHAAAHHEMAPDHAHDFDGLNR